MIPLSQASLAYQRSPECRMAQRQAYALAHELLNLRMDQARQQGAIETAVILDVDDTVLDNWPYHAWLVASGNDYPQGWAEWCDQAKADPVPGAASFAQYAAKRYVRIYYVTGRQESLRACTRRNLINAGLPEGYRMVMLDDTPKREFMERVAARYKVLLYVGDRITDLAPWIENEPTMWNVVIPNAVFGDWRFDTRLLQSAWAPRKEERCETSKA